MLMQTSQISGLEWASAHLKLGALMAPFHATYIDRAQRLVSGGKK